MALQHNLRFPFGALMLSFAWHAEREPSSGLLDIFSHALLSRSCERNLSGSDAAARPAWMQGALAAVPPLQPRAVAASSARELLPSRIPPVHPGSAPPPGCRAAGKDHVPNTATVEQCSRRGLCQQLPKGRGTGKRDWFLPKKGIREGRKKILKALITLLLHSGRTKAGVCVGTVLAGGKLH